MTLWARLLLASALAILAQSRSDAVLVLSVDMDPGTPGIQSTNAAPLHFGDTITANLFLEITDSHSVRAFCYSIQFGTALEYVSRTELPFVPGYGADWYSNTVAGNVAFRFDGVKIASPPNGPLGPNQIGSITLRVIGLGTTNIDPGFFEPAFDMFLESTNSILADAGNQSQIVLNGGSVDVAAVPEPSSTALLTTAGIGTWMARRRVRRHFQ